MWYIGPMEINNIQLSKKQNKNTGSAVFEPKKKQGHKMIHSPMPYPLGHGGL